MLEGQEVERQDTAAREIEVRLYAAEKKTRVQRKKLADKVARVAITAGGVGIILSVVAILFVIVAETLPLWRAPVAEQENTVNLNLVEGDGARSTRAGELPGSPRAMVKPLALGVDEYQEITYLVTEAGTVDFLSLADNHLLQRYPIRA